MKKIITLVLIMVGVVGLLTISNREISNRKQVPLADSEYEWFRHRVEGDKSLCPNCAEIQYIVYSKQSYLKFLELSELYNYDITSKEKLEGGEYRITISTK